ncbi:MAG: hypothetical protein ABEH83_00975 [Halobacterium sp.]
MPVRYRVVLRSTETKPSRETQESVLPAMSQKFGQRISISAADISPDDRMRAARIGTVDVDDADALCDVYEYLRPHRLVKIEGIKTDDDSGVVTRKAHQVNHDAVEARDDVTVVGAVHGDLIVRVHADDAA